MLAEAACVGPGLSHVGVLTVLSGEEPWLRAGHALREGSTGLDLNFLGSPHK